jgi:hypothetical protein
MIPEDKSTRPQYSPFDDPVVSACFSSVETAGKAIQSLSNSVTRKDGVVIAEVTSVTPQAYSAIPGERGTRVDVRSKSTANQMIILEVNMYTAKNIAQRNLLAAAQIFTSTSVANTTHHQMAVNMPFVIAINILDYRIRTDNDEWLQPAKFVYTKPPHTVALPQYASYDIIIPAFRLAPPDWDDDLYCWVYALVKAHDERRTVKEVFSMVTELKPFTLKNEGFRQFAERYEFVATSEELRNDYLNWQREVMRQQGMLEAAEEKGVERGREQGREQGINELINELIKMGMPMDSLNKARANVID